MRAFGNPTLLREETRSQWSWNWLEKLFRDIRYGARTLRRSPGFAFIAIIVIALGIGATTSLFTIVRAVLLKPLPFRDPANLVMVYEHFREDGPEHNYNPVAARRLSRMATNRRMALKIWPRGAGGAANLRVTHAELPEVVGAAAGASWNLFSVLGVQPAIGRTFTEDEDKVGGKHVS